LKDFKHCNIIHWHLKRAPIKGSPKEVKDGSMSASEEKRRRELEREAKKSKKEAARLEESKKQKKRKMQFKIAAAIALVLIVLILFVNSNVLYSGVKAIQIGDYEYTNAEFQYFYKEAYYRFSSSNQQYLSMLLDPQVPLSRQEISEGVTWADHFRKLAISDMTSVSAIYDKAIKEGYTLDESTKADLDSQMESMTDMAKNYGYKNADGYFAAMYGKGVTAETVRKLVEMKAIATDYSKAQYEGFNFDSAALKQAYAERADEFDNFSYLYYLVEAEKEAVQGEGEDAPEQKVTEETMRSAMQEAESIAEEYNAKQKEAGIQSAELSETAFRELISNKLSGADIKEQKGLNGSSLKAIEPSVFEKFTSNDAKLYNAYVVEKEGIGCYVVLFLGRDKNEYKTASFRHILTSATDEDGNGTVDEAELNKAKEQSEAILAEFNSGVRSEERFAELANEKSDDPGSNTNGGLYENVSKGAMVAPINDFIFAPGRKHGDTIIVQNNEGYSGSHLVYFSGNGMPYCDLLADQLLRNEEYEKWEAEIIEGWEFKPNALVFWFAEK
jgi:hypothetical protein